MSYQEHVPCAAPYTQPAAAAQQQYNTNRHKTDSRQLTITITSPRPIGVDGRLQGTETAVAPGGNAPVMSCRCRLASELKLLGAWASSRYLASYLSYLGTQLGSFRARVRLQDGHPGGLRLRTVACPSLARMPQTSTPTSLWRNQLTTLRWRDWTLLQLLDMYPE